jgi:hypothetical protein
VTYLRVLAGGGGNVQVTTEVTPIASRTELQQGMPALRRWLPKAGLCCRIHLISDQAYHGTCPVERSGLSCSPSF